MSKVGIPPRKVNLHGVKVGIPPRKVDIHGALKGLGGTKSQSVQRSKCYRISPNMESASGSGEADCKRAPYRLWITGNSFEIARAG